MSDTPHFNGADYVPERDDPRLATQHAKVKNFMLSGRPHTLKEISAAIGEPEASVSAQLRHLRKPRFGGYIIDREHLGNGLYSYAMRPPPKIEPQPKLI